MSSYTVNGKVISKSEVETFGSGFQKQTLRVETEDKFPQTHDIEFVKDKIEELRDIRNGQKVTVECNVNGRLWEKGNKCFTTLSAWKISVEGGTDHENALNEDLDAPF